MEPLITIAEAVALTGRSRSTIYNWISSGRLPVASDEPRRQRLRRDEVLAAARIRADVDDDEGAVA